MKKSPELPIAFKNNIISLLGEQQANEYFQSLQQEETTSVRYHPSRNYQLKQASQVIPWESSGQYLSERPIFALDPAWHAGAYYVQESSSMLTGFACQQVLSDTPVKVLDFCAAPGGKTTHLLSILPKESLLVSNEIISKRNHILVENIERWGNSHNIVTKGDAEDFEALEQFFDLVVVDAPCSGEGLFKRQPEAVEEWSEENVQICSARQGHILSHIHNCIKTGGYLCYSTCTFQPSENEEQILKLLQSGLYELIYLTANSLHGVREGHIPGTLRCWPHLVKGSGFFITLLKKIAHASSEITPKKRKHWNWGVLKKMDPVIQKFVKTDKNHLLYQSGDFLKIFPKKYHYDLSFIADHIPVTHFGIDAGQLKKNIFTPSQGLVHSEFVQEDIPYYDITEIDIALDYLRKKDIPIKPELPNGWAVVRWKGLNLGWIKQNSQRVNNYYPASLMLRM